MEGFLYYLKSLKFKGKKAAVFGCYGWSGEGSKVLRQKLTEAGFNVAQNEVKSSWNPEEEDFARIPPLVQELLSGEGSSNPADKQEVEPQEELKETPLPRWQCPCGYIIRPAPCVQQSRPEYMKRLRSRYLLGRESVHYALFEDEFYLNDRIWLLRQMVQLFQKQYQ